MTYRIFTDNGGSAIANKFINTVADFLIKMVGSAAKYDDRYMLFFGLNSEFFAFFADFFKILVIARIRFVNSLKKFSFLNIRKI